jgi:hypothetical protein
MPTPRSEPSRSTYSRMLSARTDTQKSTMSGS